VCNLLHLENTKYNKHCPRVHHSQTTLIYVTLTVINDVYSLPGLVERFWHKNIEENDRRNIKRNDKCGGYNTKGYAYDRYWGCNTKEMIYVGCVIHSRGRHDVSKNTLNSTETSPCRLILSSFFLFSLTTNQCLMTWIIVGRLMSADHLEGYLCSILYLRLSSLEDHQKTINWSRKFCFYNKIC